MLDAIPLLSIYIWNVEYSVITTHAVQLPPLTRHDVRGGRVTGSALLKTGSGQSVTHCKLMLACMGFAQRSLFIV